MDIPHDLEVVDETNTKAEDPPTEIARETTGNIQRAKHEIQYSFLQKPSTSSQDQSRQPTL